MQTTVKDKNLKSKMSFVVLLYGGRLKEVEPEPL